LDIRALRGLRYDPARIKSLADVVSPPYDLYDDDMQAAAYEKSPHHYVRVILPRESDPYQASAGTLKDWFLKGILRQESAPAVYPYTQVYAEPRGRAHLRHGFLALVKLTPHESGPVFPHERTLAKPLEDRLKMTRATQVDLEPIFLTFSDPRGGVAALLEEVHRRRPDAAVPDLDGHEHRLWVQTEMAWISKLTEMLRPLEAVIADGHHRYKAALKYAEELNAGDDHPARWKLAAFFPAFEDNVTVLPIHRVVEHWPDSADPAKFFHINGMQYWRPEDAEHAVGHKPGTLGHYSRQTGTEVWAYKPGAAQVWEGQPSETYRKLPTAAFEASVLKGLLGMSPEDIEQKKGISFVKSVGEAKRLIWAGHQRAFFLPPTRVEDIIATAKNGEVMPQKSTYFYPKVLSGLVAYPHG
jgi:uncharacterized protein (DUF1015 family)